MWQATAINTSIMIWLLPALQSHPANIHKPMWLYWSIYIAHAEDPSTFRLSQAVITQHIKSPSTSKTRLRFARFDGYYNYGDGILDLSMAGENVDMASEGQVKAKLFDFVLVLCTGTQTFV